MSYPLRETQYYLPRQTARQLTAESVYQCGNLGLLLDRYLPQRVLQRGKNRGILKGQWLQEVAGAFRGDAELLENAYRRWLNITGAAGAQYFRAATAGRLVVGMGGDTVLGSDLTLHPLYSLPFIPGSALKGMTRAYITGEVAEHYSRNLADDDALVRRIFGSQETGGTVIFFDALPYQGRFALAPDIINVHYLHYYNEQQPPTNDRHPDPFTFLTVTDTVFVFALAPRHPAQAEAKDDVAHARQWLQEASVAYGVGSKTSAGYGYFRLLPEE
jgi:CRISPR type III-B/RAMP module RAMP protein Cmr6